MTNCISLEGFSFGAKKRQRRGKVNESHVGKVLAGAYALYNKREDRRYHYLDLRVGIDLIARIGGSQETKFTFGYNPTSGWGILLVATEGGFKTRSHLGRNRSLQLRVPATVIAGSLVEEKVKPAEVDFHVGKIVGQEGRGILIDVGHLISSRQG